jgi:predicted SAM-dependent methyltransferase
VPEIIRLDATAAIPAPDNSFDYIYCEHMIEHVPFRGGVAMLIECNRILRPGGVVRVVTPSIAFLLSVIAADRNSLQEDYLEWSVRRFVPDAPSVTPAFFLNNFMRSWGHTFIYDHATLKLALKMAGFDSVTEPRFGQSQHAELYGLEDEGRLPPGYLELESMILEGTKHSH